MPSTTVPAVTLVQGDHIVIDGYPRLITEEVMRWPDHIEVRTSSLGYEFDADEMVEVAL